MTDITPTRGIALELNDERRAMREGYVFLDEKCLLLAGEMLRELARWTERQRAFAATWERAVAALQAAVARHGLEGLQVYPPADLGTAKVRRATRSLMGVALQDAEWLGAPGNGGPCGRLLARSHGVPARIRSPARRSCSSRRRRRQPRAVAAGVSPRSASGASVAGRVAA